MNPVRKWTKEENEKILEYVHEKGNFEKPTAQMYYKRLLEETKINATWDLIKFKMRYFRQTFVKANNWRKSTGAGLLDEENSKSVKDKIKTLCPYYDQLKEIFGDKNWKEANVIQSSTMVFDEEALIEDLVSSEPQEFESINIDTDTPTCTLDNLNTPENTYESATVTPNISDTIDLTAQKPTASERTRFGNKLKSSAQKSAIQELAAIERAREKSQNRKLQFEIDKFEFYKELEERKLHMEQERMSMEYNLKEREMDQNERLKKYELELKYGKTTN